MLTLMSLDGTHPNAEPVKKSHLIIIPLLKFFWFLCFKKKEIKYEQIKCVRLDV